MLFVLIIVLLIAVYGIYESNGDGVIDFWRDTDYNFGHYDDYSFWIKDDYCNDYFSKRRK